jgi:hypothetical protein
VCRWTGRPARNGATHGGCSVSATSYPVSVSQGDATPRSGTATTGNVTAGSLACVVLAHNDPVQVRRLIAALDPFPVFLHCDARSPHTVFEQMTADLPDRVRVMPRLRTPWARWGVVAAELEGYREALATTGASHVALLSGSDYPLRSTEEIAQLLGRMPGRSIAWSRPMPVPNWGLGGGHWRLQFSYAAWRKHMLVLPVPRRLPQGLVLAGGSQSKILARHHVEAVLRAVEERPGLVRRWRHSWIPDETFVYSLLHTPDLVPRWEEERVRASAWVIRWPDGSVKSPPWLTSADLGVLRAACEEPVTGPLRMFARKFATDVDTSVLDVLDRSFRGRGAAGTRSEESSSPGRVG